MAVVVVRTWYLEGLIVPCRVVGGSMADTLLGLHKDVICADCGHRFACAADSRSAGNRAVCPNCGHLENDLEGQPKLIGDGLLISKSAFRFRRPRRWEVVALRRSPRAGRLIVKRVVALPGESVQVCGGDVYVDGGIQRKTLRHQRAMAVLVHDADRSSTLRPSAAARWRGEDRHSRWDAAGGRFTHPATRDTQRIDWLAYHHPQGPITDVCSYNQSRPRRIEDIHPVGDLLLSLRVLGTAGTFGSGGLVIRASDGRNEFQVRIDPQGNRYEVLQDGQTLEAPGTAGELPRWTGTLTVEVSLFDQQFLLAFDGRPVLAWCHDAPRPGGKPTSRPLAIGSQGLEVTISGIRVYRDIYYTHPIGLKGRWGLVEPVRLGADQYFVLGDNSPISEDSRTWAEGPAVVDKLLVGKPLLVHFPVRTLPMGPWRFQVPDPAKIRYIR